MFMCMFVLPQGDSLANEAKTEINQKIPALKVLARTRPTSVQLGTENPISAKPASGQNRHDIHVTISLVIANLSLRTATET